MSAGVKDVSYPNHFVTDVSYPAFLGSVRVTYLWRVKARAKVSVKPGTHYREHG